MLTADFDFELTKEFIAQEPMNPRDHSKLLIFDSKSGEIFHKKFYEIVEFLNKEDLLVFNRSKVIPARINFSVNDSEKEIFVLKIRDKYLCEAFVRPGKFFKLGRRCEIKDGIFFEVEKIFGDGRRLIRFNHEFKDFYDLLDEIGKIPLPPYIQDKKENYSKYQTTYSKEFGSVAAPTAGLHFTDELLGKLDGLGIRRAEVVLHVGAGTFLPVSSEKLKDHKMHSEDFFIPEDSLTLMNSLVGTAKIFAVGTTSVRVLESSFNSKTNEFDFVNGETDIFIYPGSYKWKVVDGLITNFHLPKSSLIMLVASFLEQKGVNMPIEKILDIYECAKQNNYRFYSFGDSMMII